MYIQQQKNKALLVKIKYILVKNIEKIKLVSEQASKAQKKKKLPRAQIIVSTVAKTKKIERKNCGMIYFYTHT